MITLKEAKKIPFEQLDDETQTYFYEQFKRYIVRKQIADTNKELSALFSKKLGSFDPRKFATCFNDFNSLFVSADLIRELDYDEIHTTFLRDMSEERFNAYLSRHGGSFDRKIALMCFSLRPSERIANRVSYPVMQAYANMQTLVLELAKKHPKASLHDIFASAARTVRIDFYQKYGHTINETEIAAERTDYKALGKKTAPVWQGLLELYKKRLHDLPALEAAAFVLENFVFTEKDRLALSERIENAQNKAHTNLVDARAFMEMQAEENPDTYNVADYDEVFSRSYAEEIYSDAMIPALHTIFNQYLSDPIFAPKEAKEKK